MTPEDNETDQLARAIVALTGETLTEAIREALAERLEREWRLRGQPGNLAERLREIGEHSASLPDFDTRAPDEVVGYDETGMWTGWWAIAVSEVMDCCSKAMTSFAPIFGPDTGRDVTRRERFPTRLARRASRAGFIGLAAKLPVLRQMVRSSRTMTIEGTIGGAWPRLETSVTYQCPFHRFQANSRSANRS
jgi:antitoxin VapB